MRVRVFDSDILGKDKFLGQFVVPLVELEKGSMTAIPEELGRALGGAPSNTSSSSPGRIFESSRELKETSLDNASVPESPKGRMLGPFSDGRHEAWYELRPPGNPGKNDSSHATGSVQVWAQTKRARTAKSKARRQPTRTSL